MRVCWWCGAVLLIAAGLAVQGCGPSRGDPAAVQQQVVPVEAAVAEQRPMSVTREYSGTLEGEEQANIIAKISERVTGIHVRVGSRVRRGALCVELDKSGTSSQYYQAGASFRNAEKSLERMKSLYGEGAVALQALDGAQTAYDVARANFEAARSVVELTTPIAGLATAVNVSLGDLTSPGQVLVVVANVERMKVTFNLNETDAANVATDQPVRVTTDARPGEEITGRIIQLARSADVRSRSFELKAVFPNSPDRWFRPGMFVKVLLGISPPGTPLLLPNEALQSDGVESRVFRIRDGRAYRVPVEVGVTDGEHTVILRGLAEHDTVATVGINNLKDSSLVRVVSK